jgi:hypothetical protein
MLCACALASLLFGTAQAATAQPQTVGDWSVQKVLFLCESAYRLNTGETLTPEEITGAAICTALIRGIGGVLAYNCSSREEGYLPLYAAEKPASLGAAIQAYINWAKANPDFWGEDAQDGVILALMETFPCPML